MQISLIYREKFLQSCVLSKTCGEIWTGRCLNLYKFTGISSPLFRFGLLRRRIRAHIFYDERDDVIAQRAKFLGRFHFGFCKKILRTTKCSVYAHFTMLSHSLHLSKSLLPPDPRNINCGQDEQPQDHGSPGMKKVRPCHTNQDAQGNHRPFEQSPLPPF